MLEAEVLKAVQDHIPLVKEPFKVLADRLGSDEETVLYLLRSLKEKGIIRQISPIYDPKKAGYDSALVAFKVDKSRIEEVAKRVNSCPGVSHNYERYHEFNLWFTLAVPPDSLLTLEEVVERLSRKDVKEKLILRSRKTFKIGVKLTFSSLYEREEPPGPSREPEPIRLTPLEKGIIKLTQEDLPLDKRPFLPIAERLGLDEGILLEVLRGLREKGVIRRFSAILRHRKAGFRANCLVVWKVPEEKIDEVGRFLAGFKCVSHCYERTGWDYNLFTMVHGRSEEEVREFVHHISRKANIDDFEVLFSGREFLKRRIKLFTEDFYEWERRELGSPAHQGEDSEGSGKALLKEGF